MSSTHAARPSRSCACCACCTHRSHGGVDSDRRPDGAGLAVHRESEASACAGCNGRPSGSNVDTLAQHVHDVDHGLHICLRPARGAAVLSAWGASGSRGAGHAAGWILRGSWPLQLLGFPDTEQCTPQSHPLQLNALCAGSKAAAACAAAKTAQKTTARSMATTRWRSTTLGGDGCDGCNSPPSQRRRQLLVQQYALGRDGSCWQVAGQHPLPLSGRDAGAPGRRAACCGRAARRTRAGARRSVAGVGSCARCANGPPYAANAPALDERALLQVAAAMTTPPRWPWAPMGACTRRERLARTHLAALPSPAPPSLPRRRFPVTQALMAS